jgi:hypothetical protein
MKTENLMKRMVEAEVFLDSLSTSIRRLKAELTQAETDTADTVETPAAPTSIRTANDAILWRVDRRSGRTTEALCKRHEDFHWLFNLLFEEVFAPCTVEGENAISAGDIGRITYSLYDKNEFVREICDRYTLNKLMSLGSRAWMAYITTRSSFIRMDDGTVFFYGLRAKQISVTDDECQDGNMDEDDERQLQDDLKSGRLMSMDDFMKQ